jgi:hypothetical protein
LLQGKRLGRGPDDASEYAGLVPEIAMPMARALLPARRL